MTCEGARTETLSGAFYFFYFFKISDVARCQKRRFDGALEVRKEAFAHMMGVRCLTASTVCVFDFFFEGSRRLMSLVLFYYFLLLLSFVTFFESFPRFRSRFTTYHNNHPAILFVVH
jgi:hypothetical protein